MKRLIMLGIALLVCTGCTTRSAQELRQERERTMEAQDDLRSKHNPEKVQSAIKELLVGQWQFVDLEVEKGNVNAKLLKSIQEKIRQKHIFPASPATNGTGVSAKVETDAHGQTAPEPNESGTAAPASPEAVTTEQIETEDAVRLPPILVTDDENSQQIAAAKAKLVAANRKNLTVEFFEQGPSYYYRGMNAGTTITGQCNVTTKRIGDEPYPFISFNRATGIEMLDFVFGSETRRLALAKQKRKALARSQNSGMRIRRRTMAKAAASHSIASNLGIAVTADRLYLIFYGNMELTPMGWMRTGGLRCTFKRIE